MSKEGWKEIPKGSVTRSNKNPETVAQTLVLRGVERNRAAAEVVQISEATILMDGRRLIDFPGALLRAAEAYRLRPAPRRRSRIQVISVKITASAIVKLMFLSQVSRLCVHSGLR